MRAAAKVHDEVNLVLLPLLGVCACLGLCGVLDTWFVTLGLTVYITTDLIWIALIPDALPSLPKVIMLHHVITLVLLSFPLRYPHFGLYTCLDGLAEVNTFFLIARRQWRSWKGFHDSLYWITFIPSRIILYPALLYPFYQSLQGHSTLDTVLCMGAQFLLCIFNFALLHISLKGLRRRNSTMQLAKSAPSDEQIASASGSCTSEPLRTADMLNELTAEGSGTNAGTSGESTVDDKENRGVNGLHGAQARPSGSGLVQRAGAGGLRGQHKDAPDPRTCPADGHADALLKPGQLHALGEHAAALQVDTRVVPVQPQLVTAS